MDEDINGQRAGRGKPSTDYTGREAGQGLLAEQLGELARSMQGEKGVERTLDAIVRASAETVPGADEASISAVIGGREVRTPAATGELPRAVDRAQYETGRGPCLDSLYHQRSLRLSDICGEPRARLLCPGDGARRPQHAGGPAVRGRPGPRRAEPPQPAG